MSRVNIEEDAFTRARLLAKLMKCEIGYVVGTLACIWHETQLLGVNELSADELYMFSERRRRSKFDKLLSYGVLSSVGFFQKNANGCYLIVGNDKQIKSLKSYKERGKKGGHEKARLAKAEKKSKQKQPPTSNNTIQYNSKQNKTVQSNISSQSKKTPGSLVWDSYACAYARRYNYEPDRNKKTNSLCKQFAERLSADIAPQVIEFYVSHNDRWYVQKCHALDYAVKDAEKLATEWRNGVQMTGSNASKVEAHSENKSAVNRYLEAKHAGRV